MTLWEKIRDGIHEVSTKTGELIKSGAEKTAETATYTSKLTQLTWERRSVLQKIDDEHLALGALVHNLRKEKRIGDLEKAAQACFDNLASYENKLAGIDSEKAGLASLHNIGKAEENLAQDLAENLEAGGGIMHKVTIKDSSPFIDKQLKEIPLPKEALIVNIMRGEEMIIPDGNTLLQAGDGVTLLGKKEDVETAVKNFSV
jgi:K+/H+ antiporter YhaU regulatory subunit KhtT